MFHKLSAVLNQTAARLPARSAAYFWLFSGWAIMLWVLSSGNPSLKQANEISHIDKVLHFIYFSVGEHYWQHLGACNGSVYREGGFFYWLSSSAH